MAESDSFGYILVEFEELNGSIFLKPFEVCKYKDICPYSNSSANEKCFGCTEDRAWNFVCDIKKLKGE